jgi:hypothetical protein
VTGNWTSAAGSTLANQATGAGTTVTFNNGAAATLTTGSVAPAQQFENVVFEGAGTLTFGADLGVVGNLTQTAGSVDLTGRQVLVQGNVTLINATSTTATVLYLLSSGATRSLSVTPALSGDVVLCATAATNGVTQATALSAKSLIVFRGAWVTGGKNITVTKDFVAYGLGYANYTINSVPYNPNDDGELAMTRAYSYYAGLLGYPYFGTYTAQNVIGMNAAISTFFNVANSLNTTVLPTVPASGTTTGRFTLSGGEAITVGQDFYNFGASMTGASPWTLSLPTKYSAVTLNQAKSSDWFGRPFAVALSTVTGAMSVTNSTASQYVAAAQTAVGGTYTAGTTVTSPLWTSAVSLTGTTKWDNTQGDIDTKTSNATVTRFDNLVDVGFSKALKNAGSEVSKAVASATAYDDLRFDSGTFNASNVYLFNAGTIGQAAEYSTATLTTDDAETRAAFKTTGSETWNTDATGTSPGASVSTNRSGVHQTTTADITLEKGRLYDLAGNPFVNHDGLNYNGSSLSSVYTAVGDLARPVLIKIAIGQAAKHFPPSIAEDGHNYWHLVWSAPVLLDATSVPGINNLTALGGAGTQIGNIPGGAASGNLAAVQAFGDSFTVTAGSVQLTGAAQYTGANINLYRGARSQGANFATTGNQTSITTTNSLARSSAGNDLYIYLVGASTGTGTSQYWDGFWWTDAVTPTSPVGSTFSVPGGNPSPYYSHVKDLAGNYVEESNITWPSSLAATISLDPNVVSIPVGGTVAAHQDWEYDTPSFAPYSDTTGTYEVVPVDTVGNGFITQIQIHVLANVKNSGQNYNNSDLLTPDSNQVHFGIRDSSLTGFANGFTISQALAGPYVNTYNLALDSSAPPYNGNTTVNNTLFDGTSSPTTPVSLFDGPYFTLDLTGIPTTTWLVTQPVFFSYNAFAGMATNLAGGLLPSVTDLKAIDRTAPYITLTLAANGGKTVYVQFSRVVKATSPGSFANYHDVLTLLGAANSNSVTSMQFLPLTTGGTGSAAAFQEALLTLASPLAPTDYLAATLVAGSASSISAGTNNMSTSVTYPVSNLGIDLVEPVWATDGTGGEANTSGTAHVIHDFTGGGYLAVQNITLQAKVLGGPTLDNLPLKLYYDNSPPSSVVANGIWLTSGIFEPTNLTPLVPATGDSGVRYQSPSSSDAAGDLKTFVIPGTDSKLSTGKPLQFIFQLGSLPAVRSTNPNDPRFFAPYLISFQAIKTQKNGVTILHNVINPNQGQEVELLYTMKQSGAVTVQVFALDGSLVRVLQRGRQASGDYSLFWDGKNAGGRVVARGIYFIRVVAPDTDETRNVMVIK